MRREDGRFISILLALIVPLGGWLTLEYMQRQDAERILATAPPIVPRVVHIPVVQPEPAAEVQPELSQDAQADTPMRHAAPAAGGPFRCVQHGRTVYTDHPQRDCPAEAATQQVYVAPSAGVAPTKSYQQQLAEASQRNTVPTQTAPVVAAVPAPDRRLPSEQCAQIDAAIASVDAALRQPHDAQRGDWLTQERRRLMDQRSSTHC